MIGFGQCISGDCENGYGTSSYGNGDKYTGEWKNNMMNGRGTYTFGEGAWKVDIYVGEYKNNMMNGRDSRSNRLINIYDKKI